MLVFVNKKFSIGLIIIFLLFLIMISANVVYAVIPVASDVSIDSGAATVNLSEGATKSVVCTATVTDMDGCSDISTVSAVFFRTNIPGGADASDDPNNHYSTICTMDGGSCTGGGDLNATYTCNFSVYYYAEPTDAGTYEGTDWTCQVIPSDDIATGTPDVDTIEMGSLAGISIDTTIDYGSLALGTSTGSTNQGIIVTNRGNVQADIMLDGYGIINGDGNSVKCTIGSVPVSNQQYATSSFTYGSGFSLSDTATELDFDLPRQNDPEDESTLEVFWGFGMPANGAGGSCSGVVVFTAVNDILED